MLLVLLVPVLALIAVGTHIVRQSPSESPDRFLGAGFIFVAVGLAPRLVVIRLTSQGSEAAWIPPVDGLSHALIVLGVCLLTVFVRRVFRARERWAGILMGALMVTVIVPPIVHFGTGGQGDELTALGVLMNATRPLMFIWAFFECLRFAGLMSRRVKVGLAEPLVANRFRLWAVWTGVLGFAPLAFVPLRLYAMSLEAQGLDPRVELPWLVPAAALMISVAFSFAAVAAWLSFFPPQRYQAIVQRRFEH
jgi:hypothetical protein